MMYEQYDIDYRMRVVTNLRPRSSRNIKVSYGIGLLISKEAGEVL